MVIVFNRISCLVNTKNPIDIGNASIKFINVSFFLEELTSRTFFLFTYLLTKKVFLCKDNIKLGKGEVVNGDLSDRKYYRYSCWKKSIELVLTLLYSY